MKLEEDYETNCSKGSSTRRCYSVEAKYDYPDPKQFGRQIFDKTWRMVYFDKDTNGAIGVPDRSLHDRETIGHGFLSYQAAQSLRWWLHASAEAESLGGALCLSTRLIMHEIKTTYEITALSYHDHIHGDNRSNIMPDYGIESEK